MCGSHQIVTHLTESLCFPKGGVFPPHRLTMLSHARLQKPGRSNPRLFARHARLQKPGRSNPRISCVFPKGCVAPTQKNHCVSPKVEWLLPHRFIVFSQRLCGSRHTDSLCCINRACGSHCTESLCFPKGCMAPITQNLCVVPKGGWLPPNRIMVLSQRGRVSTTQTHDAFPKRLWLWGRVCLRVIPGVTPAWLLESRAPG